MKIIKFMYLISTLLCNNLCAVEIRYERAEANLFEPITIPAYVYKENIECMPANACMYYASENDVYEDDCLSNFFQNYSIDSIETSLTQNFDTECDHLLHEFLSTEIYKKAKNNIDQFIVTMLSNYETNSVNAQLTATAQAKDYQWKYLHDENNTIIGVAGSIKKMYTLSVGAKSAKNKESICVTIEESLSFPLLKIIGKRLCRLMDKPYPYCLLADVSNPNQLIPLPNITTVDLVIQERPRLQLVVTVANNKTPNDYIAFKADVFLGEKNSLIEETCHINDNQYYLAKTNPDHESKQFISKKDLDIKASETPPYIFYSLLHSKKRSCVVLSLDGMMAHNQLNKLEHIKSMLECFSKED